MSKVTLNTVGSRYGSLDALNDNFDQLETAIDNTLSRDGTGPNAMEAPLDMGGFPILNATTINATSIVLGGQELEPSTATITPSAIQIFEYTATAGQTSFPIAPFSVAANAVEVEVDGITLPPSTISVVGTNVITPAQALSSYVVIRVFTRSLGAATTAADLLYTPEGGATRSVQAALREQVNVWDFPGVVGNGVNNDLPGIQLACASGKPLNWGNRTYRITDTLVVSSPQTWKFGGGSIILDRTSTFIKPAVVFALGSETTVVEGIKVNHNATGIAQPTLGNQVAFAWCSAVVVMADDVRIFEYDVSNAWDNGISVGLFNVTGAGTVGSPYVATQTTGKPERVVLANGRSKNCGVGEHNAFGEVGKKGAGVNVLTGTRVLVDGHVDNESYNGVIVDFAGGAQATVVNCVTNLTRRDSANPANGSGISFYLADGVLASNCKSYFAERHGFVMAGEVDSLTGSNLYAYASQEEGFVFNGGNANLSNITADSCSQAGSGLFDGIRIDSAEGPISNLTLLNVRTRGNLHRWGVNLTGANTINAAVTFSGVNGVLGPFNANPATNHFLAVMGSNFNRWGFGCVDPGFEVEIAGETASWSANVVGDSGGNGTFVISDRVNRARRLAMGYDTSNNVSVVQSVEAGVSVRPLLLNPSGGRVQVGLGTWNNPVVFGPNRVWFETSSPFRMRFKNGSDPVNETDGTVVGTQS